MTAKIIAIVGVSVGAVIAMFIGGWLADRDSNDSNEADHIGCRPSNTGCPRKF